MGWENFFKEITNELGEVIEERIKMNIEGEIEGDFDEAELELMRLFYTKRAQENQDFKSAILNALKEVIWDDKYDTVAIAVEESVRELISPPKELC